ncbi:hypothetical protein [Yoonia sp. 208BN28-4]|uniref:hypothetical protein n=1 Tax=Yoonia sp. 208BN28-4 TaxID=3126505 RepID=UPI0030AB0EC7
MTDHSETQTTSGNPATKIAILAVAAIAVIGVAIAVTDDPSEPNVAPGPEVQVNETGTVPADTSDTEAAAQMEFSGNAVSPADTDIYTETTNDGTLPDG